MRTFTVLGAVVGGIGMAVGDLWSLPGAVTTLAYVLLALVAAQVGVGCVSDGPLWLRGLAGFGAAGLAAAVWVSLSTEVGSSPLAAVVGTTVAVAGVAAGAPGWVRRVRAGATAGERRRGGDRAVRSRTGSARAVRSTGGAALGTLARGTGARARGSRAAGGRAGRAGQARPGRSRTGGARRVPGGDRVATGGDRRLGTPAPRSGRLTESTRQADRPDPAEAAPAPLAPTSRGQARPGADAGGRGAVAPGGGHRIARVPEQVTTTEGATGVPAPGGARRAAWPSERSVEITQERLPAVPAGPDQRAQQPSVRAGGARKAGVEQPGSHARGDRRVRVPEPRPGARAARGRRSARSR